jgi:hypothetical protein
MKMRSIVAPTIVADALISIRRPIASAPQGLRHLATHVSGTSKTR